MYAIYFHDVRFFADLTTRKESKEFDNHLSYYYNVLHLNEYPCQDISKEKYGYFLIAMAILVTRRVSRRFSRYLDISKSPGNVIYGRNFHSIGKWDKVPKFGAFLSTPFAAITFCPVFFPHRRSPDGRLFWNRARWGTSWLRFPISRQFPRWTMIDHETFSLFLVGLPPFSLSLSFWFFSACCAAFSFLRRRFNSRSKVKVETSLRRKWGRESSIFRLSARWKFSSRAISTILRN